MLAAAWTRPLRRSGWFNSDQSASPAAAVGSALDDAEPDEGASGGPVSSTEQVEHEGAGPEADREVGEYRMQRMPEPDAVQGVLDPTSREHA